MTKQEATKTGVEVTHRGEDYATIEVSYNTGEIQAAEIGLFVADQIDWLNKRIREQDREIKRLLHS